MLHSSLLTQIDAVARHGSIRRAAVALNVSASSINRRIIQLEEQLGSPLFHRRAGGMQLTAAGEVVVAHIRQTLRDADRMASRIEELQGLRGARVRISAMQGLADGVLPRALIAFRARYPAVRVTVRARTVGEVESDLHTGEADLGLAYAMVGESGIQASSVVPTRLGAVVAAGHPLARRSDVRLSEIAEQPIAMADESLTIHGLIAEAFDRAGLRLAPDYMTNSTGLLKFLAREGTAITFLSRIDVAEDVAQGVLRYVPILGQELRGHELRLGHRRGAALNPAASILEEDLRVLLVGHGVDTGAHAAPAVA
ncbi:MAG: LysR substrate-binding domain-containing protein [Pseudomonadota bacterium]